MTRLYDVEKSPTQGPTEAPKRAKTTALRSTVPSVKGPVFECDCVDVFNVLGGETILVDDNVGGVDDNALVPPWDWPLELLDDD